MKNALLAVAVLGAALTFVPAVTAESCTILNGLPVPPAGIPTFGIFACSGSTVTSNNTGGTSWTIKATPEGEGQGTPTGFIGGTTDATLSSSAGFSGGSASSLTCTGAAGFLPFSWGCKTMATLTISGTWTGGAGGQCATFVVTSKTFDTVLQAVNSGQPVTAVDTTAATC